MGLTPIFRIPYPDDYENILPDVPAHIQQVAEATEAALKPGDWIQATIPTTASPSVYWTTNTGAERLSVRPELTDITRVRGRINRVTNPLAPLTQGTIPGAIPVELAPKSFEPLLEVCSGSANSVGIIFRTNGDITIIPGAGYTMGTTAFIRFDLSFAR